MRDRLRTKSEGGKGWQRKQEELTRRGNGRKKVWVLQNIFLTVHFVNRIPQPDAENLKHATSVKVKKNSHHARLFLSIIHGTLKKLLLHLVCLPD